MNSVGIYHRFAKIVFFIVLIQSGMPPKYIFIYIFKQENEDSEIWMNTPTQGDSKKIIWGRFLKPYDNPFWGIEQRHQQE